MPILVPPTLDFNAANGKQLGLIRTAFLAVFVRRSKLVIFLSDHFDKNFDEFAEGEDFEDEVFNLLRDARGEGWLADLVNKAIEKYERATALKNVVDQWFLFADAAPAGRAPAAPVTPPPPSGGDGRIATRGAPTPFRAGQPLPGREAAPAEPPPSQIERLMNEVRDPKLAEKWLVDLGVMRRRVCLVSREEGSPTGTGFLIGPDVVLTTGHVARAVRENMAQGGRALAEFDYETAKSGRQRGRRTAVRRVILGSETQPASAEDLKHPDAPVSYGLLELAEAVGAQDDRGARGWFDLDKARADFSPDEPLFVLHHPGGLHLHMSEGIMVRAETRSRLRYRAETAPGSGGAPIFDRAFRLVGLHEAALNTNLPTRPGEQIWGEKIALRADAVAAALKARGAAQQAQETARVEE